MATLEGLIQKIIRFNKARGWNPVPSDIAKSIVIESSELLEHFQWDESKDNLGIKSDKKDWGEIGAELADILWYIITFSNAAGLNLGKVLKQKIRTNDEKYPEKKFAGKHNPDFYKRQKRKYRKAFKRKVK